jgi:serine/threonine protein kinase
MVNRKVSLYALIQIHWALANHMHEKNVISGGSTGLVEPLPCGNARKIAYPESNGRRYSLRDIEHEFRIYQALPRQHDRLLQMISYSPDDGLVVECMPAGNLRHHLRNNSANVTHPQRLQWACDAAEALQLVHTHRIIHCDVKPENFLVDGFHRLKIIDFSGSSFDGKIGSAMESTRFCPPRSWDDESTVRTDLFALGSTIYEIMTGTEPYKELADEEVEARYSELIFPSVDSLPCGQVIMGCWKGEIKTAEEAMVLIKGEMEITSVDDRVGCCTRASINVAVGARASIKVVLPTVELLYELFASWLFFNGAPISNAPGLKKKEERKKEKKKKGKKEKKRRGTERKETHHERLEKTDEWRNNIAYLLNHSGNSRRPSER